LAGGGAEFGREPLRRSEGQGDRREGRRVFAGRARRNDTFVAVDDIVAVHANAHYSYIYDGTSEAVLSARHRRRRIALDTGRFVPRPSQPHRQYRLRGRLEVGGDNGAVELRARIVRPFREPQTPDRYAG